MSWSAESLHARQRQRRAPLILQSEAAECGLACLGMVLGAYGFETDLPGLRQRFVLSLRGTTMADLVRMADSVGLQSRALRAELDELVHLQTPCVLHWDLNHFVVLVRVGRRHVDILDPARGARRVHRDELSRSFSGVALELSPALGFKPLVERRQVGLRQLLGRVRGWRRSLLQVLSLALALEFLVLLGPLLLQWIVDQALPGQDKDLLLTLGVGFALLIVLQTATAATRGWALMVLSSSLNLQWAGNVFTHLLRLPVAWFEKRHPGEIWSRFGAVQQIQRTLTGSFIEVVLDGVMVVLTFGMMIVYSPVLAGFSAGAVILYGLVRGLSYPLLAAASEEVLVYDSRQLSHFLESVRGIQAVKLFNAQAERQGRFASLMVQTINAQLRGKRIELTASTLQRLIFGLERVGVVWLGSLMAMDGRLSLGMLFAFLSFRETFALRMGGLVDKVVELHMLRLQGDRLADIVLTAPEVASGISMPLTSHSIELRNVSFRYADGEPDVLSHVNLRIESGESVAIIGPSGCGKSTLLRLLLGIHSPTNGQVLVGGVPLSKVGLVAWRGQVAAVMQDEPLFTGSVADNIAFFASHPDPDWIEACARMAEIHDEIIGFPMGYQTLIGDIGSSISGGQRQRILLARALYKRPKVLLLDEATSSLDVERERQVNKAIRQLALTRVIVAHRPETIASAGRVIALAEGRVAQDLRAVGSGAPGH